ncbi:adenylate/guanylate cyclase domain-containing protein [bacterium]|nr:adenylate/guanylate cyclase domain-containing protein [bacterium]MBU1599136.1 adenylate/guanylate cyclase domain-containing protein [bacterium]
MVKKNLSVGLLFGAISGLVIIFLISSLNIFKGFELTSLNYRFASQGGIKENAMEIDDVVIVDIDNASIRELGRWQNWPRSYYAEIIDYMKKGGVAAIGSDVFFPDYGDPENDKILISATKRAQNVVHSFHFPYSREFKGTPTLDLMEKRFTIAPIKEIRYELNNYITPPIREIQTSAGFVGYVNKYPDEDGVTRHIPLVTLYNKKLYFSMALATLCQALNIKKDEIKITKKEIILGTKKRIPVEEGGKMWIKYVGASKSFRFIPFVTVLKKQIPAEYFKGKIIIIGGSAEGLFDITSNPFSPVYPGVEIHANIIHNILVENFMRKASNAVTWITIIIVGIITGLFSSFLSLKKGVAVMFFSLFGYLVACFFLFETNGLWLEMVSPSFSILTAFSSVWLWRFSIEQKKKEEVKGLFSRYVNKGVVERLVANPDSFKLGGERMKLSVLFSDICGFTSMSERLSPEEVVSLLNEYFTAMNEIIFRNDGTLDKFIGDAIMVIYGAPMVYPEHAQKAVITALEMRKKLKGLQEAWKEKGGEVIDIGIGINTGEIVVGNIGSNIQTNYTVIGDEVNLASRLEGLTRNYPDVGIIISKATYNDIKDIVVARELDVIRVKGKLKPVVIYEPLGLIGEVDAEKIRLVNIFLSGLMLYRAKRWKEAGKIFESILSDGPARMYYTRCQEYIAMPPRDDWDGVYTYKTK